MIPTRDDAERARATLAGRLPRTPLLSSRTLNARLKCELFQRTGSFKARGALNKISSLTAEERGRGVIAISAGNHAQATAYAAASEGIDALVVMWQGASEQKINATRGYGATVDLEASGPGDAFDRLDVLLAETGRTLVHPFDDPLVIAGAGTVGLEIEEDAPDADAIVVPVGGGGLISGIQIAIGGGYARDRGRAGHEHRSAHRPGARRAHPRQSHVGRRRAERTVCRTAGSRDHASSLERVLVTEQEIEDAFRFHLCEDETRLRTGRRGRGRGLARGQDRRRAAGASGLRRQRRQGNGRCYPGPAMKTDIHPEYVLATVHCSCGNTFTTRSTKSELHVEICSNCHPFYTGKQKLVDTGGRVERFQRRLEKAERAARASS